MTLRAVKSSSVAMPPPYDPITRPWYLDLWWDHFKGRPFPVSGSYGFSGTQTDATGHVITVASSQAQGSISLPLHLDGGAGAAAYFTPGEIIVVGDGGFNWQSFLAVSINAGTDTLTVYPRVQPPGGWPAGSLLQHGWGNTSHPSYTYSAYAWAAAIVNAKQRRSDGNPTLLPPNGAGNGNDLGSMQDPTTVGGLANCPTGWTPAGTAADVACTTSSYAVTALSPVARTNHGLNITSNTASGSGIKTSVNIPVVPGQDYTLSWQGYTSAGSGFKVQVNDSTTTSIVLGTYTWSTTAADFNTDSLAVRTTMQFTAPGGTTGIQIQLLSQTAADGSVFADFRLHKSRESPLSDRYVLENPQGRPIILLGDSWTYGNTAFAPTVQNRLGANTQVMIQGVSGITVSQMVANMATMVLPYSPAYCVLGTGFQNDMSENLSVSSVQSSVASFIDTCRQSGIIPVIPGVSPASNTAITGGSSPLQWSHDLNDAIRAQCALVTS